VRLLYVHQCFGNLAGAEANALITASELKRRGHSVAILHGPGTGKHEEHWRTIFEPAFPMGHAEAVDMALKDFQPDVVYVHKTSDLPLLERLVQSGFPLVRMVHDHDIYCMRSYKYGYFSRRICERPFGLHCLFPCGAFLVRNPAAGLPLKWVSYSDKAKEIALNKRFDRMFVVTPFMRDELLKNGFAREKIRIMPPVPRMGDSSIRAQFSNRNLIIYAGQIIRGKGVDVLLHALAKVRQPFECVILGDGNHKAYCQKLSKELGLEGKVHFKGFVPQEELKNYYREATLVAISSVWPEPIATIGLEVMRYGLPVVAFNAGGVKDWLTDGENGFLVPWMDTAVFAERIDQLLGNKQLAQTMGAKGLALVTAQYDFESYISNLEEQFSQLSLTAKKTSDVLCCHR